MSNLTFDLVTRRDLVQYEWPHINTEHSLALDIASFLTARHALSFRLANRLIYQVLHTSDIFSAFT